MIIENEHTLPIYNIIYNILRLLINLGMATYTLIILAKNFDTSKVIASNDIYIFIISVCGMHYILSIMNIISLYRIRTEQNRLYLGSTLALSAFFIWSCVILFEKHGMELKSNNPFFMVVFVHFISTLVVVGISIILLPLSYIKLHGCKKQKIISAETPQTMYDQV